MMGIGLIKTILLGLGLSISVIPIICEITEDVEGVIGFSRIRPMSTRLEGKEEGRPPAEGQCGRILCGKGIKGALHCARNGCLFGCSYNECNGP
ncbi:secreted protein [Melampsora americana]|nr:secreted protein [Melampsora americana]